MLQNGAFNVKRTGNGFAIADVGMALESAYAIKNRLRGVINFADVSTVVNKWIVTEYKNSTNKPCP